MSLTANAAHIPTLGDDEEEEEEDRMPEIVEGNRQGEAEELRKADWTEDEIAWALGDEFSKSGSGNRDTEERQHMASMGSAMPGGRYPVGNADELKKAIRAVGRGKGSHDAIRKYIVTRAKALGLASMLPEGWSVAKFAVEVPIWKRHDDPQHLAYGVVMEPDLRDSQGDVVSAPEIEKAAHRFMAESRRQDIQHSQEPAAVVPVESYIAPHDMVLAGQLVRKGAWVMVSKVNDPEVWERIANPRHPEPLTGYSIGGSGFRSPD